MKQFTYLILAISIALFFSCTKEMNINENASSPATVNELIPETIVAEIDTQQTRTQYASNSIFGWTSGDKIRMPLVMKTSGSITECNYYTFTTSADNGSTTATFTKSVTYDDLESYDPNPNLADATYTNMGYLIYPDEIFNKEHYGDYPVVTLPSSFTYNSSAPLDGGVVPMIGRKVGETYKFSTAVGILKIPVSNVSSSFTSVKLVSSDKKLSGKFYVSDTGVAYAGSDVEIACFANTSEYNSEGVDNVSLTVSSLTNGDSYDFYFPVPVGTYGANTLSLQFISQSGETENVVVKRIKKDLTVARNEVLELPSIALSGRSVAVARHNTCCPEIDFTLTGAAVLRFNVTQSAEEDLSGYIEGNKFTTGTYWYMANTTSPYTPIVTSLNDNGTGKYYLHYIFLNTTDALTTLSLSSLDDSRIIEYGTIPFNYLSPDVSNAIGTYYINNKSSFAITIAASDDSEAGDVMISHFTSLVYDVDMHTYGTYDPLWGKITFNAASKTPSGYEYAFVVGGDTTYDYPGTFTDIDRIQMLSGYYFALYQLVDDTWTDKDYKFTGPALYKQ